MRTSVLAHRTRRVHVDMVDVRTWSQKIKLRDDRNGPSYVLYLRHSKPDPDPDPNPRRNEPS